MAIKDLFNPGSDIKTSVRYIFINFIIFFLYFISGKFSLEFAFLNKSASPFWIPTGISIVAFLSYGYKVWPAIFVGAFAINFTTTDTVISSVAIAIGNTLEGIAALFFINKFLSGRIFFDTSAKILKYFAIISFSTFISAVIGTTSLSLFNLAERNLQVFLTWWIGDLGGALIFASVFLVWLYDYKIKWSLKKTIEATIYLILLISTTLLIFNYPSIFELPFIIERYPFPLLTFPLFLIVAFRFGIRETASFILIFYLAAFIGIINGSQRMELDDPNQSLLNLQIFTIVVFILKMSVAAAITQRGTLEKSLHASVIQLRAEINERKKIEEVLIENESLLKASEIRYKNIFEMAGVSIWVQDFSEVKELIDELKKKGIQDFRKFFDENQNIVTQALLKVKVLDVNEQTLKIYKAKTKDDLLNSLKEVFLPETIDVFKEELIAIAEGRNYMEAETVEKNLEGERIDIFFTIRFPDESRDFNKVLVSIMDITTRKQAEAKIQASLKEKEILVKEIHHRVKNNLQIISSLLNLQSSMSSDNFRNFFITSQNRISSMAIVHEMLYKNANLSEINFRHYAFQLSKLIIDSYNYEQIKINIMAEDTYFNLDTTLNLGLILNEIITNSIKHAFNGVKNGVINIELKKKNNLYSLSISDNGRGLPKTFDLNSTSTLGVRLISSLTSQLNGKLEIKNNVGTEFFITFEG